MAPLHSSRVRPIARNLVVALAPTLALAVAPTLALAPVLALVLALATAPAAAQGAATAPRPLPALLQLRAGGRAKLADAKHALAIERGLRWLRAHQDRAPDGGGNDGRWAAQGFTAHCGDPPCDAPGALVHDVGITALALLALLGDGAGLRDDEFRPAVERGLAWLTRQQDRKTGVIGTETSHAFIYGHVLAATALCEGYALLASENLRVAAQRALDYLESHRNPKLVWRYFPRDGDNDTSVTTWCIAALVLGHECGLALKAKTKALACAADWYDSVTDVETGRAGYQGVGETSARLPGLIDKFPPWLGEALTASALYGRYLLGQRPTLFPEMARAVERILERPAAWDVGAGSIDLYYWYHAALALQALDAGPRWLEGLRAALLSHQRTDGHADGSWDAIDPWSSEGGRVYATALAILMLEVPYRYAKRQALDFLPRTPAFAALRQHWDDGRFDRLSAALQRLEPSTLTEPERAALPALEAALQDEMDAVARRVARLAASTHYAEAQALLKVIERSYAGLAPGAAAHEALQRFERDPLLKAEIRAAKASEAVRKLKLDPEVRAQRARLVKELDQIVKQHGGTRAANEAKTWADAIRTR